VYDLQTRLDALQYNNGGTPPPPPVSTGTGEYIAGVRQPSETDVVVARALGCQVLHPLKQGAKGDSVYLLQLLLYKHGSYPEGLLTGYFGGLTRNAVETFQNAEGLEAVGFVGPRTAAALGDYARQYFPECETEAQIQQQVVFDPPLTLEPR
jgi:N-acetylmuramoyl-L-alanine amidase